MGLLDMCCPKKPKKSLDYVIKWVEDTDKTIKDLSDTVQELNKWKEDISEETLRPIFDEYAETYPWDNVPAFNAKADKVENVVAGHLASLDENGNLQDSGKKPADFVPNVSGATEGNLPQFDAEGNIQDSGNKAEDFALVEHSHSVILDESTESRVSIEEGRISIFIEGEGSGEETEINANNIGNLHRALTTPSSIPENNANKLITSKAVYDALALKKLILENEYDQTSAKISYPITQSARTALQEFVDSVEANKTVPVIVELFDEHREDGVVIGTAKWNTDETQQEDNIYVEITVGKYKYAHGDCDIASFDEWDREAIGQNFL